MRFVPSQRCGVPALIFGAALSVGCSSPSIHGRWDAVVVVNQQEAQWNLLGRPGSRDLSADLTVL